MKSSNSENKFDWKKRQSGGPKKETQSWGFGSKASEKASKKSEQFTENHKEYRKEIRKPR